MPHAWVRGGLGVEIAGEAGTHGLVLAVEIARAQVVDLLFHDLNFPLLHL